VVSLLGAGRCPFEDGFDTARELKINPDLSKIPIMMLTSFSHRKGEVDISVAKGMELEAEDYVEKPVELPELLRRVDKLLKEKGCLYDRWKAANDRVR
jgi:DNA-binding response OmpR family regulator